MRYYGFIYNLNEWHRLAKKNSFMHAKLTLWKCWWKKNKKKSW